MPYFLSDSFESSDQAGHAMVPDFRQSKPDSNRWSAFLTGEGHSQSTHSAARMRAGFHIGTQDIRHSAGLLHSWVQIFGIESSDRSSIHRN